MTSFRTILKNLWPEKIRTQLIVGIALIHLALMSVFVFDTVNRQSKFLKEQNHEHTFSFLNDYAVNANSYIIANDYDGLERLTTSRINFPNLKYAMILSAEGEVLAHTNLKYVGSKPSDSISNQLLKANAHKILVETDQLLDIGVPIYSEKKVIGWARVGVGQEYIQKNMATIIRDGLIYIVFALILGTFFAILIGDRLSRGLYKLIAATEKIRSGDHQFRVTQFHSVELSMLGTAFNQMVDEVSSNERVTTKINEQLSLSESVLRSAFEHSAIGMSLVLPNGKWTRVNKALCKMLGYSETELLSLSFQDITWPEDLEPDLKLVKKTLDGELNSYQMEKRYFHKDGSVIWARLSVSLVRDGHNTPLFFISQIEDISERKRSEASILQLNRLYLFNSAINDRMLHAENKKSLYNEVCKIAIELGSFSLAWIGFFSRDDQKLNIFASAGDDNGYIDMIKEKVRRDEFEKNEISKAINSGKPFYCNDIDNNSVSLAYKDEALRRGYKSVIALPVFVNSRLEAAFVLYMPETNFFTGTEVRLLQEVTNNIAYAVEKLDLKESQRQSQLQLQESEEKFRKLVEETLVGVFILQNGRFVYVNPQLEKITGYSTEVLLGKMSIENLIHQNDLQKTWQQYVSRINSDKHPGHYFPKIVTAKGTVLQIELIASAISYKGAPAVIGTIVDITAQAEEEKRLNKAVTDAQEKQRQLISMELHDNVKQMMAASLLNIDFLKMVVKDEATTVPIISNVKNYMREAIEELRRIAHQLAPSVDETLSLEEKFRTVVDSMNVSGKLTVNYHFDDFEEDIESDVQLAMYRILQEQFSNILKYADASLVEIKVHRQNGDICMAVEDNGVGFDPRIKKQGIGLENIKRRVQVFNGNFKIQSTPGNGCKLDVQIPTT